ITFDCESIQVCLLVGLAAGLAASQFALGHGFCIVGDVLIGIFGAFIGGFLSVVFHWSITIVGHPIISEMLIAFIGAALLLIVVRILGMGRGGARRRAYWS